MSKNDIAARSMMLLERVRIAQWADVRVKKFSKGMTQRLGLACALVHRPNILLLDEPTDGVDPIGRREIRDLLRDEAKQNGASVLVNSHLLSEIELTCDKVAVLRRGKVAAAGTIDEGLATVYACYQTAAKIGLHKYDARALKADEGGLAPPFTGVEQMLDDAVESIRAAGFEPTRELPQLVVATGLRRIDALEEYLQAGAQQRDHQVA